MFMIFLLYDDNVKTIRVGSGSPILVYSIAEKIRKPIVENRVSPNFASKQN